MPHEITIRWKPQPRQEEFLRRAGLWPPGKWGKPEADEILYGGAAGGGKALALDTPLPTPTGWTTMGEVKVGDWLLDEEGRPCRVTFATDVMYDHPCYEVVFDDGSTIVADAEHRWLTFTAQERAALHRRTEEFRAKRRATRESRGTGKRPDLAERNRQHRPQTLPPPTGEVRTTEEIRATLTVNGGRINHAVPVAKPLQLPEAELPIPPYVLGLWLGDGNSASAGFTTAEPELLEAFTEAGYRPRLCCEPYYYYIDGLRGDLNRLGLINNKHIPSAYLRASEDQRLALLQGLMDTDGTCTTAGKCEFTTTNRRLAEGVLELLASLGIKATMQEGRAKLRGRDVGPKYRITFTTARPVFRLSRKRERQVTKERGVQRWRYIVDVRPVPSVPVRCIQVDSPSHLYLAGRSMIPTHNTDALLIAGLLYALRFPGSRIVYFRRTFPEIEAPGGPADRSKTLYYGAGEYRKGDHEWTFVTGSILKFTHLQEEGDKERHRGAQYDLVIWDELTLFTRGQYEFLRSRNRTTVAGAIPLTLAASNPGGIGHGWVKARFNPSPNEVVFTDTPEGERRLFIPAKVYDNAALLGRDPTYLKRLMSLPEAERKAMLDGDWDVYAGMFFGEWTGDKYHVVDPFEVPKDWIRVGSYDFGYPKPSVYSLYALPPGGGAYKIAEMATVRWEDGEPKPAPMLISDQIEAIKELERQWGVPRYRVADPAIWGVRNHQTGEVMAETFAKAGIYFIKADNDRINGWMRLREWLKVKPGPDGEPAPLLRYFKHCRYSIWSIPTLVHDPNRPGDLDTDGEDHAADTDRYFVMSRPAPGRPEEPEKSPVRAAKEAKMKALKLAKKRSRLI